MEKKNRQAQAHPLYAVGRSVVSAVCNEASFVNEYKKK